MNETIRLIAERIRGLRELLGLSTAELAAATHTTEEEYALLEKGENDFSFTFLYLAAARLGVDITELLTGEGPKLSLYCYVPDGKGLPIKRRKGFSYQHMAYLFKNKQADPFVVCAKADDGGEIALSRHEGQEFDYVLEGSMRMRVEDHEFVMKQGDAVYYDARHGHGMAAVGGDCKFLAVVIKHEEEKQA